MVEASSEAAATVLDSPCVVSAVRVRVPAAGFKLNRGGRYVRDNGADRGLEIVGEANKFGTARRVRRLVLGILRCGVALGLGYRLHLELFDRACHLADFVPAPEARQHDFEIAAGELAHRLAHRGHRPRNATAEQERQDAAEQETAGRKQHDQALGLADARIRLRLKPLLIRKQVGLHGARELHDRRRGIRHIGNQLVDLLRIVDQFGQRLPVVVEQCSGLLETLLDFLVLRRNRAQRILDELEARHRAGRDGLVGIDDEGVGERRHRLKLVGDFLGAELDRLQLGIVGIAGEIVELVTQHIGAAGELILRHQRAVALEFEDFGKNLGEGFELPRQPRDLIEARRT